MPFLAASGYDLTILLYLQQTLLVQISSFCFIKLKYQDGGRLLLLTTFGMHRAIASTFLYNKIVKLP